MPTLMLPNKDDIEATRIQNEVNVLMGRNNSGAFENSRIKILQEMNNYRIPIWAMLHTNS